jgi:hypothetical protein
MSNNRDLNELGAQNSIEFELNPLISEIVLWNDAEILDDRPEFAQLNASDRIALICEGLFSSGVAEVEFLPAAVWLPTDNIEHACGGSNIVPRSHYVMRGAPVSQRKQYEEAIERQLRRRLEPIVNTSVALFRLYNRGLTKINGRNDKGMLRWRPADAAASASRLGKFRIN